MNDGEYNSGVRIADESIYSEERHNEKPKELFKRLISVIKGNSLPSDFSIYDIGCASGDFLGYTKSIFPQCQIFGTDISEKLITHAKKKYPEGKFQTATIEKENVTNDKKFDVVNLKGVLTIFDKPEPILINCLSYVKKNGLLRHFAFRFFIYKENALGTSDIYKQIYTKILHYKYNKTNNV